jgi:hypothetical protein
MSITRRGFLRFTTGVATLASGLGGAMVGYAAGIEPNDGPRTENSEVAEAAERIRRIPDRSPDGSASSSVHVSQPHFGGL